MSKVLLIDVRQLNNALADRCAYRDTHSAVGFDIAVWSPEQIVDEFELGSRGDQKWSLTMLGEAKYREVKQRRMKDFDTFFAAGGVLFYFADHLQQQLFTRTGVELAIGIVPMPETDLGSGISVEAAPSAPKEFAELLGAYRANYQGRFPKPPGKSFAQIRNTQHCVGYYYKPSEGGHIVVLPGMATNILTATEANDFLKKVEAVASFLKRREAPKSQEPDWAESIKSKPESTIAKSVEDLQSQIGDAQTKLAAAREALASEQKWKGLFYAGDETFHLLVIKALQELGIRTIDGVHPYVDALGIVGSQILAIEAKGREKGGAKNVNVAQCNTWVAHTETAIFDEEATGHILEYQAQLQKLAIAVPILDDKATSLIVKGVLVINGFRQIPLKDRADPVFHQNINTELENSDLLGLSGLTLFAWIVRLRSAENDTAREEVKSEFAQMLQNEVGAKEIAPADVLNI